MNLSLSILADRIATCELCPRLRGHCRDIALKKKRAFSNEEYCYITAGARCAPPDDRPTLEELDRCRPYLEAELALLESVRLVLTLGRTVLISSFHPSRQNTNTGRLTRPMWHSVFERIRMMVSLVRLPPASPSAQPEGQTEVLPAR